jgi:hypothetical protein
LIGVSGSIGRLAIRRAWLLHEVDGDAVCLKAALVTSAWLNPQKV